LNQDLNFDTFPVRRNAKIVVEESPRLQRGGFFKGNAKGRTSANAMLNRKGREKNGPIQNLGGKKKKALKFAGGEVFPGELDKSFSKLRWSRSHPSI